VNGAGIGRQYTNLAEAAIASPAWHFCAMNNVHELFISSVAHDVVILTLSGAKGTDLNVRLGRTRQDPSPALLMNNVALSSEARDMVILTLSAAKGKRLNAGASNAR
jgi:hypothetical protein